MEIQDRALFLREMEGTPLAREIEMEIKIREHELRTLLWNGANKERESVITQSLILFTLDKPQPHRIPV